MTDQLSPTHKESVGGFMKTRFPSRRMLFATVAVACAAAVPMIGGSFAQASSKSAAITVWVDAPRVPAVKAFEKAYPNIPVKLNVNNDLPGASQLEQKFALFNQAGSGWPDAIFFPDNDDVSWASSAKIHYTANLAPLLPANIKAGYAAAAIAPCVYGTKWECVRNDVAPDVLWYNATLFKQWGYTPPTTWPQYETLSLQIAKDHPGYFTGMLGDAYAPDRYLWASGCPTNDQLSATVVHININDPKCTRAREDARHAARGEGRLPGRHLRHLGGDHGRPEARHDAGRDVVRRLPVP